LNSISIVLYLLIVILRFVKGNSLFVYGLVMMYNNIFGYFMRYPSN
jgi:hypothetical protein